MIAQTRVQTANLFGTESKSVKDLAAVVHPQHIAARKEGTIGAISKGVPGIEGGAVLVRHEDGDGFGRLNGEIGAYYACELNRYPSTLPKHPQGLLAYLNE